MQVILFAFTCRKTSDATTYNLFCIGRHDLNLRLPIKSDDLNQWLASALGRCVLTRLDFRAAAVVARKQYEFDVFTSYFVTRKNRP
jgi:hypothetical protein